MSPSTLSLQYENSSIILWWNRHHHVFDQFRRVINAQAITRVPARYLYFLYYLVFLMPLEKLYLYGPTFRGWGFWGGRKWDDICSELTQVDAEFWHNNKKECANLIERHFFQFVVFIQVVVYFYILYKVFTCIWGETRHVCCRGWRRWKRRSAREEYRRFSDSLDLSDSTEDHTPPRRKRERQKHHNGRKRLSVSA